MPSSNNVAPIRVEVLLNGRRIALAGVEEFGVISAIVSWVRRSPAKISAKLRADPKFDESQFLREVCDIEVGGLNSVTEEHLSWAKESLAPGNELTIRILGP